MPFSPDAIDKNRLMPSHEGNEVSFEFESINTTIERDVTQTPLPPEPNVEL